MPAIRLAEAPPLPARSAPPSPARGEGKTGGNFWRLVLAFPGKQTAYDFETYLKSHSGRAFARKRLIRSSR